MTSPHLPPTRWPTHWYDLLAEMVAFIRSGEGSRFESQTSRQAVLLTAVFACVACAIFFRVRADPRHDDYPQSSRSLMINACRTVVALRRMWRTSTSCPSARVPSHPRTTAASRGAIWRKMPTACISR
jgi:hypothetical protein